MGKNKGDKQVTPNTAHCSKCSQLYLVRDGHVCSGR